jgi:hypothetical protein
VVVPDFEKCWIRHPNTNVDLAIMPLGMMMNSLLAERGLRIDDVPLSHLTIPSASQLSAYGVFQEVKFMGYPTGLWDSKNNLPIVRRGMTASDPVVDYEGRKEFLIDAAVFGGSSGSPVFVASDGPTWTGDSMGSHGVKLLGIVSAVYQYDFEGKVTQIIIPSALDFQSKTTLPINLGVVIKSSCLEDFETVLQEIAAKNP